MTLGFSSSDEYLVVPDNLASVVSNALPGLKAVRHGSGLFFYLAAGTADTVGQLAEQADLMAVRYLDRFRVLIPASDLRLQQHTLDAFFRVTAEQYETLIDVTRNRDNIDFMLRYLKAAGVTGPESTVVDYGCGTGLALEPASRHGIELIGLDRCPAMRAIAKARGLQTWGPGDLARQPRNSIRAVFASYVFHLIREVHSIRLLASRIMPGGLLIGNCHKGEGADLLYREMERAKFIALELKPTTEACAHGRYIAFTKSS